MNFDIYHNWFNRQKSCDLYHRAFVVALMHKGIKIPLKSKFLFGGFIFLLIFAMPIVLISDILGDTFENNKFSRCITNFFRSRVL